RGRYPVAVTIIVLPDVGQTVVPAVHAAAVVIDVCAVILTQFAVASADSGLVAAETAVAVHPVAAATVHCLVVAAATPTAIVAAYQPEPGPARSSLAAPGLTPAPVAHQP